LENRVQEFSKLARYFSLIEKKKPGSFLAAKIFCRHGRSIVFEKNPD